MLGSAALGVASLATLSGCGEGFEKLSADKLGVTVFAKVLGGNPGGLVAGAELYLTLPGRYVVQAFKTSAADWDHRNQSLRKVEFTVTAAPHQQTLQDWEPSSSVLLHIAMLDEAGALKTQALGFPQKLLPGC